MRCGSHSHQHVRLQNYFGHFKITSRAVILRRLGPSYDRSDHLAKTAHKNENTANQLVEYTTELYERLPKVNYKLRQPQGHPAPVQLHPNGHSKYLPKQEKELTGQGWQS